MMTPATAKAQILTSRSPTQTRPSQAAKTALRPASVLRPDTLDLKRPTPLATLAGFYVTGTEFLKRAHDGSDDFIRKLR